MSKKRKPLGGLGGKPDQSFNMKRNPAKVREGWGKAARDLQALTREEKAAQVRYEGRLQKEIELGELRREQDES